MKVVRKKCEVICWFEKDGTAHPLKVKIEGSDGETHIIKIDRILQRDRSKMAGSPVTDITCEAIFLDKRKRTFVIRCFQETLQWELFKM